MAADLSKALDEVIEVSKRAVGEQTSIARSGTLLYNDEATRDTIKHYAWGVSDMNPLWLDEGYAARSRFGGLIAPPTFLYSVVLPSMGRWHVKFPESVHWTQLYGGTTWEFGAPLRLGDRIHVAGRIRDVLVKESRSVGRMAVLMSEVRYWNQRGELVGTALNPSIVFPTQDVAGSYESSDAYNSEGASVAEAIEAGLDRRGDEPLYWEDVVVGDNLPELPKGRLRMVDIIRWNSGAYGPLPVVERLAGDNHEIPGEGHYDAAVAKAEGLPGLYDNGPLRGGWLSEVVTNWMGDWGDLVRLSYELRRMNVVGDVNVVGGRVSRKDGDLVVIDVWVENHRGEKSARGTAAVRLPRRVPV